MPISGIHIIFKKIYLIFYNYCARVSCCYFVLNILLIFFVFICEFDFEHIQKRFFL
ncbi:hypothetical protein GFO_0953 [Christiangramia forsetii KT0803]|uniref:Uncharacterized protein n=1 Tax=Christiangramia forsetii (strain DSM 17595 / CGMCC 1.15422 / KT0803) TaxID=411154 RepID=A0LZY2_CHRFK|nr:hypothetical protein GFO_0953 [Christiangramia forsetii KT0803]